MGNWREKMSDPVDFGTTPYDRTLIWKRNVLTGHNTKDLMWGKGPSYRWNRFQKHAVLVLVYFSPFLTYQWVCALPTVSWSREVTGQSGLMFPAVSKSCLSIALEPTVFKDDGSLFSEKVGIVPMVLWRFARNQTDFYFWLWEPWEGPDHPPTLS